VRRCPVRSIDEHRGPAGFVESFQAAFRPWKVLRLEDRRSRGGLNIMHQGQRQITQPHGDCSGFRFSSSRLVFWILGDRTSFMLHRKDIVPMASLLTHTWHCCLIASSSLLPSSISSSYLLGSRARSSFVSIRFPIFAWCFQPYHRLRSFSPRLILSSLRSLLPPTLISPTESTVLMKSELGTNSYPDTCVCLCYAHTLSYSHAHTYIHTRTHNSQPHTSLIRFVCIRVEFTTFLAPRCVERIETERWDIEIGS